MSRGSSSGHRLVQRGAAAHKEWPFEETPDRIKTAQQLYERGPRRTLEEFAKVWLQTERRS